MTVFFFFRTTIFVLLCKRIITSFFDASMPSELCIKRIITSFLNVSMPRGTLHQMTGVPIALRLCHLVKKLELLILVFQFTLKLMELF